MTDDRRDLDARPSVGQSRESFDVMSPRIRRWMSPLLLADAPLRDELSALHEGALLDVGCGAMPYRSLTKSLDRHDGVDIVRRIPEVTYESSITDMSVVPSGEYNFALCSEVLEHVDNPVAALSEICRVMKPGGRLLLTVPFLSRLHEEPHDYFRYTEHGLRKLLTDAGFDIERIDVTSSLFSFLGHQVSSVLIAGVWRVPLLRWVGYGVNAVLVVFPSRALDRVLMRATKKLPAGYLAIATKRPSP